MKHETLSCIKKRHWRNFAMYPYEIIWGMGLYEICIAAGVIAALAIFRVLAERRGMGAKYQNFILITAFVSVVLGYISAVVFQAYYNYLESGVFEIRDNTGATFLGGLIGGSAVFLLVYFGIGYFLFKGTSPRSPFAEFPVLQSIAGASIAAAHGLGRFGCFFAGCCHGIASDSFLGMYMRVPGYKVIPVQLYEAVFLLILSAVIFVLLFRRKSFHYGLSIYMIAYGIWRFFIEYLRGDDRGAFLIRFLSPSQFTSLLLIVGGGVLLIVLLKKYGRKEEV